MNRRRASPFILSLLDQLDYFERHWESFLEKHLSTGQAPEEFRAAAAHLMAAYIIELKRMTSRLNPDSGKMVFIGSKVSLQSSISGENKADIVLCFPDRSNPEIGWISFLSPTGIHLLLRPYGGKVHNHVLSGGHETSTITGIEFLLDAASRPRSKL
ncbi:GreA/GreB family elongation factor [Paenibacillus sp. GD4]|jgi:transcription elongation factor GreA|uniref:GreA/GreB family elongation factor n=1 Tax=Paenibacillus sp. GD4 TaxID=3068890 RepID=UPI0027966EEA|nr:GreA/GreB family elongation factor [Paenibacillus sp. GD4]MDQ1914763.1 GreA/GreB family elongation factor [Paenibacillus sp. GD4]